MSDTLQSVVSRGTLRCGGRQTEVCRTLLEYLTTMIFANVSTIGRCGTPNSFFQGGHVMTSIRLALATLLLMVLSAPLLFAQTATGEVNGTITDPNGGAVPGAAVKLINQATKIEIEATANQSGAFTFVNVKPADYVLRVEVSGFKRSQTASFNLGVSQTITQNVVLTVGEVTEVVEVTAASELVQGSTSELGTVIS